MNTKGADRSESRQPVPIEIFNYLIFEDSGTGPKVNNLYIIHRTGPKLTFICIYFSYLVSPELSDFYSQQNVGQFIYSPILSLD